MDERQKYLHHLLEDGCRYAPIYQPAGNSDHLPMTLCAIYGLGGSQSELSDFKHRYESRLQPVEAVVAATEWQRLAGRRDAYAALAAYFQKRLKIEPVVQVLSEVLNRSLSAIAIDAFHPVIRLGFALDFTGKSDNRSELAAALAYMVSAAPLRRASAFPVDTDLTVTLAEQLEIQCESEQIALQPGRFSQSLSELQRLGQYPVGTVDDLSELAEVALALYRSSRNFFALHLVTATQALRVVLKFIGTDSEEAIGIHKQGVAAMTGAFLASHLVLGCPRIEAVKPPVSSLDEEHALKYCWACLSEYQTYGDDIYLQEIEAFREQGLVPAWVCNG